MGEDEEDIRLILQGVCTVLSAAASRSTRRSFLRLMISFGLMIYAIGAKSTQPELDGFKDCFPCMVLHCCLILGLQIVSSDITSSESSQSDNYGNESTLTSRDDNDAREDCTQIEASDDCLYTHWSAQSDKFEEDPCNNSSANVKQLSINQHLNRLVATAACDSDGDSDDDVCDEYRGDAFTQQGDHVTCSSHLQDLAPLSFGHESFSVESTGSSNFQPTRSSEVPLQGYGDISKQHVQLKITECVTDAKAVGVVNVLGYDNVEKFFISKLCGVNLASTNDTSVDDSDSKLFSKWQLTQLLYCVDQEDRLVWEVSEPVKGTAIQPILCNTPSVPLIIIASSTQLEEFQLSHKTSLVNDLHFFLDVLGLSSRNQYGHSCLTPVIVICSCGDNHCINEEELGSLIFQEFYFHSDFLFSLTPLFNNYNKIVQAIKTLIHVASPWLELEKMVVVARCEGNETFSVSNVQSAITNMKSLNADFVDSTVVAIEHLEANGLIVAGGSSVQLKDRNYAQRNGSQIEDFLPLLLQPKTFSDCVNRLFYSCNVSNENLSRCRVPGAYQYGLIPKESVKESLSDVIVSSVHYVLHKTATLLDPLFISWYHSNCTEKVYVADSSADILDTNLESLSTNARHSVLIPALLKQQSHSSLPNGYVSTSPLAFRQPGPYQRGIPLSVFYRLIAFLMKHFPIYVKCFKHSARFHIEPHHLLDIEYMKHYIKVTVHIRTTDQPISFASGHVCSTVKEMIASQLNDLTHTLNTKDNLKLQPAVLVSGNEEDFVDLHNLNDLNSLTVDSPLYSIGGNVYYLSNDFYLWFGQVGQIPNVSRIQSQFFELSNRIDPLRASAWLYQRQVIHQSDLDRILTLDEAARSLLLLRTLEKQEERGLKALDDIMQQETLWKSSNQNKNLVEAGTQTTAVFDMSFHDQHVPTTNKEQNSVIPDPGVVANRRYRNQSQLNQLNGKSDVTASESQSADTIGHSSSLGRKKLQQSHIELEQQTRSLSLNIENTKQVAISSSQRVASISPLDSRPVIAPSVSVTRPGLQEQEMVFPRSHSKSPEFTALGLSLQAAGNTNTQSELSEWNTDIKHVKQDPDIHPIFECKYYHVERATDGFNERSMNDGGKRLGVGSFGMVFHGVLHSETGQEFEVAVKRLKKASSLNSAQVELSRKQFGTEMNLLTRYLHKNVVRLIGFSSDGPQLCLIYEYLQRGALSHRLDCKNNTSPLNWQVRLSIGRDIVSALEFLHTSYRLPVIHRDVKSSNVLLGPNFEAKLSDFGLAVIGDADGELQPESPGQPSFGTRPYMAPEALQGVISTKGDVFGLGVIIFELATGLPPYSSKKKQDLKSYLEDMERQHVDLMKMLDPKARWPNGRDKMVGLDLLNVGKLATERDQKKRPDVTEVFRRLHSLSQ